MIPSFDEDIKIYGQGRQDESPDFESLVEHIDFNETNGNKEKAEKLGGIFAALKPTDEDLCILGGQDSVESSVLYQARVLIHFLCGRTIKKEIRDSFLIDFARKSMYDAIKRNEPDYYKNLTSGAAYSFYRVAFKKNGESADTAGAEFAKLCGASKDEYIIGIGRKIYTNTVAYAKALIEKCGYQY